MHFMIRLVLLAILSLALSAGADQVLHTLPQLKDACAKRKEGLSFSIDGQVVTPPAVPRGPFTLGTADGYITLFDTRTNRNLNVQVGDQIRVTGRLEHSAGNLSTNPNGYTLDILFHGILPEPPEIPVSDFLRMIPEMHRVAIRGTITDVLPDDIDEHYIFLILEKDKIPIFLTCLCTRDKLPGFQKFLGHEVVATGIPSSVGSGRFRDLGKSLSISGIDAIHLVAGSTTDPFDTSEIPLDLARNPLALTQGGWRKTSGTVIARWQNNHALLKRTDGTVIRVEFAAQTGPQVGTMVDVVGMPETDLLNISIARALWRPSSEPTVNIHTQPMSISLRELFTNHRGNPHFATHLYGKLLRLTGTIKSIIQDEKENSRIILEDNGFALLIDGEDLERFQEGCRVQVTGVCIIDSDAYRPGVGLPKIRGFFLASRDAQDLEIISAPPWWTPRKFVLVLMILLCTIITILIWNVTLRRLVTRKSRALLREQAAKLEETLKIDERTRLAAELHDYLAQNLTVISYQVSAAESALATNSAEAADCLKTADRMLLSCRTDLRRCLWDLKSDALNEPDFSKAVERTAEPVAGDANLHVRFAVSRNRLSDSTAHAVLSICRELVSNAIHHGKADKVQIAGELKDGALRFSVRDNGIGFDPTTRPGQTDGHFGLDGVAERIRRLNGQLQIDSTPGKGTRIVVTLRPKDSPT